MLCLDRKEGEGIRIGNNIVLRVIEIKGKSIRLGVEAPKEIRVSRIDLATCDVCKDTITRKNSGQSTEEGIICSTCLTRARLRQGY